MIFIKFNLFDFLIPKIHSDIIVVVDKFFIFRRWLVHMANLSSITAAVIARTLMTPIMQFVGSIEETS